MCNDILEELDELEFLDLDSLKIHQSIIQSISASSYKPGEALYQNNNESTSLFIIRSGLVKLVLQLPNGRTRIVRLHKKGSVIGMEGMMDDTHEHTAIAVDDVSVFQIPHSCIEIIKTDDPSVYNQILEKWYQYLSYADTWIADFSTGPIKSRVARLIMFLAKFDSETGPHIVELLTTDEMSEILGVTPESASRVLADFKRNEFLEEIENNSGSLYTCNHKELARIGLEK